MASTGAEVTTLQQDLVAIGYSCTANGTFDSATDTVVRKFQGLMGLDADGIVGSDTRSARDTAISQKNVGNMCRGMISEDIRQLQANLNTLGYNCGTADGEFGINTYSAVCNFQLSTGTISPNPGHLSGAETILGQTLVSNHKVIPISRDKLQSISEVTVTPQISQSKSK